MDFPLKYSVIFLIPLAFASEVDFREASAHCAEVGQLAYEEALASGRESASHEKGSFSKGYMKGAAFKRAELAKKTAYRKCMLELGH